MTNLTQKLRKQLRIRPIVLAVCVFILGVAYIVPASGAGNSVPNGVYMICDDFKNLNVPDPQDNVTPVDQL